MSLPALFAIEIGRMAVEAVLDDVATYNEHLVNESVRFRVEYIQLQTRLRLDIPALSDPDVQDVLQEADAFARSFQGMGALGLSSPLDVFKTLVTVASELCGQALIISSLFRTGRTWTSFFNTLDPAHALVLTSALLPTILSVINSIWTHFVQPRFFDNDNNASWPYDDSLYTQEQAEASEKNERMRRLAYDESFKAEVMLFGLAQWILDTWVETRKVLQDGKVPERRYLDYLVVFTRSCVRELTLTFHAVPLIVQLSTGSLGSISLYKSSIQSIISSLSVLSNTMQMAFQGVFLMTAFDAARQLKPAMEPSHISEAEVAGTHGQKDKSLRYQTMVGADGRCGMKVEARNLSFTYPGSTEPVIKNLNLVIQPGETVAIVGQNGGGKTTLAHLLLRLYSHEQTSNFVSNSDCSASGECGQLLINDIDSRRYSAKDLHAHSTAVFQGFSRLVNASVRENVGIGSVDTLNHSSVDGDRRIECMLNEVGLGDLPLDCRLDPGGFRSPSRGGGSNSSHSQILGGKNRFRRGGQMYNNGYSSRRQDQIGRRGELVALSGGQWQRVAIARALMRQSHADLIVLDEASSQLDAYAQRELFANVVTKNKGKKTIIFITHRLEAVKWADKIAFFDEGSVTEFGTHNELMALDGSYASLFRASASSNLTSSTTSSPSTNSSSQESDGVQFVAPTTLDMTNLHLCPPSPTNTSSNDSEISSTPSSASWLSSESSPGMFPHSIPPVGALDSEPRSLMGGEIHDPISTEEVDSTCISRTYSMETLSPSLLGV